VALGLVVDLKSTKVGTELRLNGFSIFAGASGGRQLFVSDVTGFVVEGQNLFEVYAERVEPPPELEKDEPFLELRLSAMKHGADRFEQDVFLGCDWTPDTRALAAEGRSKLSEHAFSFEKAPARYRFLEAPELREPARAAQAVVTELVGALRAKKLEPLRRLFALRFTELSLAAEVPREETEDALLLPLGELMAESGFEVLAPGLEGLEVVPGFGGRVAHLRARGGRPPVVARVGQRELSIPLSIAEIDGVATIVR
jgi:hypothetical protein